MEKEYDIVAMGELLIDFTPLAANNSFIHFGLSLIVKWLITFP